jgi:mannose-1-phosphate guanylyltransferase
VKAFLLAAGRGTRLAPLTDRVPKCLVEVGGRTMLDGWFDRLRSAGVTDVLVNTHHLADRVEEHVRRRPPAGLRVELRHEPVLLGSAGTVRRHAEFAAGEPDVLVAYADNWTTYDPGRLVRRRRALGAPLVLGLFRAPDPRAAGIALCDADGRVTAFEEKPRVPPGPWANAGLYVLAPEVLAAIPDRPVCDFGFDVLPLFVGRMYGERIPDPFIDVGTPERLEEARRLAARAARGAGGGA